MRKKILLSIVALGGVTIFTSMFAAFEAHVVNVTAQIENALAVTTDEIDFGTVFPQEHLDQPLGVALSQSFLAEDRVDDVEYFIRQKPKCGVTTLNGQSLVEGSTATGHVVLGDNPATEGTVETSWIDCGQSPVDFNAQTHMYGVLPSLCEYISKEPDGLPVPGNDGTLASFHQPYQIIQGDNPDTQPVETSYIDWTDTSGRLAKSDQDTVDNWNIDLAVPCFGGHCAQDWADFVHGINPDANPDDYDQPIANEHKIFGCDLWIEVTEVSETGEVPPPEMATLTVTKVVTNDNGGNNVVGDFQLQVDGNNVTSGAPTVLTPGAYAVSEIGVSGYQGTYGGDCDNTGNVTLVAGDSKNCTVTNNDIAPNITLIKNVINNNSGTAQPTGFIMRVDGTPVPHNTSIVVTANTPHTITEDPKAGYTSTGISGSPECPAVIGGTATLDEGEAITCTITNDDNPPI